MTRILFTTVAAAMVSAAAATSLLAEPVSASTKVCESNWIIVASGDCPASAMDYCNEQVPDCEFNSEATYCSESPGPGFTVYCQV